jgi:hypothetical protein
MLKLLERQRSLTIWLEPIDHIRLHKAETAKKKDCRFDPQGLASLRRSFVALKLLDAPPDMSKLYVAAFKPDVQ